MSRLTVEIRPRQRGTCSRNDFIIKELKVYQNKNYTDFIKDDDDFKNMGKFNIGCIVVSSLAGAGLLAGAAVLAV